MRRAGFETRSFRSGKHVFSVLLPGPGLSIIRDARFLNWAPEQKRTGDFVWQESKRVRALRGRWSLPQCRSRAEHVGAACGWAITATGQSQLYKE